MYYSSSSSSRFNKASAEFEEGRDGRTQLTLEIQMSTSILHIKYKYKRYGFKKLYHSAMAFIWLTLPKLIKGLNVISVDRLVGNMSKCQARANASLPLA
jgi:hypothetical protein